MKLWSYGDSHAAGHELGTEHAHDLAKSWLLKEFGYGDRNQAKDELGLEKYNVKIKKKWYKHINNQCIPELSYAGLLANKLGYKLVSQALPGSSNSLSMLKMYQDIDKWDKDDIILFSVVTPLRFIPANDIKELNHQVHWLSDKDAEVMWRVGPHDVCFKLQTHGYIKLAKSLHKNVFTLKTVGEDTSVEGRDCDINLPISFTDYLDENGFNTYLNRYPGGHLHETCHELFADYIYNELFS